jgi:hypothetical protein
MDYLAPSFYAHIINGVLLLTAVVVILINYKKITRYDGYPGSTVILILLLSIAIGIHGISHLGLESVYSYNPLKKIFQQ